MALDVMVDGLMGRSAEGYFSILQDHTIRTSRTHGLKVVANEENSPSRSWNGFHLIDASFLKVDVTNCQDFVNNQNFRLQMRSYCKCKSDVHSRWIPFHWCVYKLFHLWEINNWVQLLFNFFSSETVNGSV